MAQKLFDKKEKRVQVLKNKLKIPYTQIIQTSELTEFEKEKEALNTELIDCKAKQLKLKEKQKHQARDAKILIENEKDLKTKLAAREKELQEKCEEVKNQSAVPFVETYATSLCKAMSQVNLKDVELIELKKHNKNLEEKILKREQENKEVEEKCQELMNRNTKLTKQVVGQMALQGARNMIWDKIILEANKLDHIQIILQIRRVL